MKNTVHDHQPVLPTEKINQQQDRRANNMLATIVFLVLIVLCSLFFILIPHINTHPLVKQSTGLATAIPAFIGSTTAGTASASSSLVWSYTVGAQTNQIIIVGVSIPQSGVTVSSVTYAGIAMKQAVIATCPAGACDTEQWYLTGPPAGTNNIIITLTGISTIDAGAATFSGVDPVNPIGGTATGKGNNSNTISDPITSTSNQVVVDSFIDTSGNMGWVPDVGQAQLWGAGNGVSAGSSYVNGINGSVTLGWTNTLSGNWEHSLVAISGLPLPTNTPLPTSTQTPTPTPVYNLTAHVFVDNNTNGTQDPTESNYQGATVTLSGNSNASAATNGNGDALFGNLIPGTYGVNLTVPPGYANTTPTSQLLTIRNQDVFTQFGIFPIPPLSGCAQVQPADIMMIFDLSGSMANPDPSTHNPKIDEAKKAGALFVQIIAQNQPNARIGITVLEGSYNWGTPQAVTYLLSPFTNNYSQLLSDINNMQADTSQGKDNTCFDCAIWVANHEYATGGRPGVKNITLFLTDGLANMTLQQPGVGVGANVAEPPAMQLVQQGNSTSDIIYNTIGLGHGNGNIDEPFLKSIAYTSGGLYYNDPDQGNLETIYTDIADGNIGTAVLKGFVYNDNDFSQTYNAGDSTLAGWTLQLQNGANTVTAVTDQYGNYSFPMLCTGTYLIQEVVQNGWFPTVPINPAFYIVNITDGNTYNRNFGNHQGYSVKGSVFNDVNKNEVKDNGESNYTGGINISSTGGDVTVNADGTYSVDHLPPGQYLISYNFPSPKGYILVYPNPPSFLVTVGPSCSGNLDTSHGAYCDNWGNIFNLNFAISNSIPWMQTYGLDVRMDNGFTDDVPQNPLYPPYALAQDPTANTPGILFIGNGSVDSGWQNQVSSTNWIAGGGLYPEVFSPTNGVGLLTSYQILSGQVKRAGITPIDVTSFPTCSLANCKLPPGLGSGAYIAYGDLNLNAYDFSGGSNYIFLIQGTLTINGKITVPNGSTALFSAAKDINIAPQVGTTPAYPLPPGQLQGIYSADRNFTIQGIKDCLTGPDLMLNMEGALIVNAAQSGGVFTYNRDLCGYNLTIPAFTIKDRLDFLLNAPGIFLQGTTISHEDAP